MDANLINPFLSSVINILSTMANIDASPGKPQIKTDNIARGIVTGLITMEEEKAQGSLAISFSKPVILEIIKKMLSEELTEVDDTAKDMTGELANMVMGGAKNILCEQGYDFGLSTPAVLFGEGHEIEHPFAGPNILLPLSTESGEFYIEICFKQ